MGQIPTSAVRAIRANSPAMWRFSLAELMFFTAVVAFCCLCWKIHVALGMGASAILLPGCLRAISENRSTVRAGFVPSLLEKVLALLVSCGIVTLVLLDYGFALFGLAIVYVVLWVNVPYYLQGLLFFIACALALAFLRRPIRALKETWPE